MSDYELVHLFKSLEIQPTETKSAISPNASEKPPLCGIPSNSSSNDKINILNEISDSSIQSSVPHQDSLSHSQKLNFNHLLSLGNKFVQDGLIEKAIKAYLDALDICPDHIALSAKIDSLFKRQDYINSLTLLPNKWYQTDLGQQKQECVYKPWLPKPFKLSYAIYESLYPHQLEGIAFLCTLFEKKTGGILADDMGLGKTVQATAFLHSLFYSSHIHQALIIVPLSLISNWEREIAKWCLNVPLSKFYGPQRKIDDFFIRYGITLTTYGVLQKSRQLFADSKQFEDTMWDVIILDEGQKIKNTHTQTYSVVSVIQGKTKVILSGTPIPNLIQELWVLFDYCCDGQLLGDRKEFVTNFEDIITRGNLKDATEDEKSKSYVTLLELRKRIAPYFLRREKKELLNITKDNSNSQSLHTRFEADLLKKKLPIDSDPSKTSPFSCLKYDFVCWITLTPFQFELYTKVLSQKSLMKQSDRQTCVALSTVKLLQQISNHPGLIDLKNRLIEYISSSISSLHCIKSVLLSSKLQFISHLVQQLSSEHHRILIFSQSLVMLDFVGRILDDPFQLIKYVRLDGNIKQASQRQAIVDQFDQDSSISCFLLTTQVGGIGLNLTSADRVIIIDPSWNLASDNQAVDRAYRIGQKKDVIVYRLITCGTIEEYIYRRQIFKGALSINVMDKGKTQQNYGFFSRNELRRLFDFNPKSAERSHTQNILDMLCSSENRDTSVIDSCNRKICHFPYFSSISDHGSLYSKEIQSKITRLQQDIPEFYFGDAHFLIDQLKKTIVPKDIVLSEKRRTVRSYLYHSPKKSSCSHSSSKGDYPPFGITNPIGTFSNKIMQSVSVEKSSNFLKPQTKNSNVTGGRDVVQLPPVLSVTNNTDKKKHTTFQLPSTEECQQLEALVLELGDISFSRQTSEDKKDQYREASSSDVVLKKTNENNKKEG